MGWPWWCRCCCSGSCADADVDAAYGDHVVDAVLGEGLGSREVDGPRKDAAVEAEAEAEAEFVRLHREVLRIVRSDVEPLPGFTFTSSLQTRLQLQATLQGSIDRWQDTRGTVEAELDALKATLDACSRVGWELHRALSVGDDARILRCLDVAVRLGLERGRVVTDGGGVERCRRVVEGRIRDLELSGAGDVMRWLDGAPRTSL